MEQARTRIVATVGPASEDAGVLSAMVRAGADVLRVNGAHASLGSLAAWVRRIRRAAKAAGRTVGVMVDLPGVKMRTGSFGRAEAIGLAPGSQGTLSRGSGGGTPRRIPVRPWPEVSRIRKGAAVLLDDGRLRLRVLRRRGERVIAEVEEGGVLASGKGVAFPGCALNLDVPTRRDRALARAAIEAGADWLSQSFVRSASDIARLKAVAKRAGAAQIPVIAKIERGDAMEHLDAILDRADAAIVARGDLGVDVGAARVPPLQKEIIEAARRAGRPAIVATEMLDSMTHSTRPTRAEVSDVAGAVFEGTDGVLLSGETAVGRHPALAVETMDRILRSAEADVHAPYAGSERMPAPASAPGRPDQHVVHAAVMLARETSAEAVVVFTRTGASAIRLSKERPRAPIHAFAPRDAVCRRLSLAWGVRPRRLPGGTGTDEVVRRVLRTLRREEGLAPGARAVLVMGGAKDPAGATTLIKLLAI